MVSCTEYVISGTFAVCVLSTLITLVLDHITVVIKGQTILRLVLDYLRRRLLGKKEIHEDHTEGVVFENEVQDLELSVEQVTCKEEAEQIPLLSASAPPPPPPLPSGPIKNKRLPWKEIHDIQENSIWYEVAGRLHEAKRLLEKERLLDLFDSREAHRGEKEIKVAIDTVIDAKKALNLSIVLWSSEISTLLLGDSLKNLNCNVIKPEFYRSILTFLPDEKEVSKLRSKYGALQFDTEREQVLTDAEIFSFFVSGFDNYYLRAKSMAFQNIFNEKMTDISKNISMMTYAAKEVINSVVLREFFAVCLAAGNILNESDAQGFQIEFLKKIPRIKTGDRKTTFLEYLKGIFENGLADASWWRRDFSKLFTIDRIELAEINQSLADAIKEFEDIQKGTLELAETCPSFKTFLTTATESVATAKKTKNEMDSNLKMMVNFIGDSSIQDPGEILYTIRQLAQRF